jgi:LacI family transcriptional regulator
VRRDGLTPQITIRDVAKKAGVSTATVSRVLNDHPGVSDPTRRNVRAAIEALSYNLNQVARSLKTRASRTVGIIVPELASDFFMGLAESMESKLAVQGYSLLVCSSYENVEEEKRRLKLLTERLADAIVMIPATDRGSHIQAAQRRGTPLVLIDRTADGCCTDTVLVDNEGGAYQATKALIGDGFRRIGFIGGDPHISTSAERYLGYKKAMSETGLEMEKSFVRFGPPHIQWGTRAMREMWALPNRPQAYFIVNLYTHIGATEYLLSEGGPATEGIVFAAFDEMPYSPLLQFCRYSVAQPIAEMGAAAARLVIERIVGRRCGEPETLRFATKLIRHTLRGRPSRAQSTPSGRAGQPEHSSPGPWGDTAAVVTVTDGEDTRHTPRPGSGHAVPSEVR